MQQGYKFSRRHDETNSEYAARCALWSERFKNSGHALDLEAVPPDVAEQMRIANAADYPFLVDREPGETDAEYAARREHWRRVVAGEPLAAGDGVSVTLIDPDTAEGRELLAGIAAARVETDETYDLDDLPD